MAELITRTAKLVPYAKRPKQVPSFVTAYAYEPLTDEPAATYGNFYVVIEVLAGGRQSEEVADLIIETFGQHYYDGGNDQTDGLTRFEAAIKGVNHGLSDYVGEGNAAWIGKLSAVIAVQNGNQLHISHSGSADAYLYRGRSATRITTPSSDHPAGPRKTFSTISSGELEDGDRLMLATPALLHQLPLKRLHDVVAANSPNRAISELMELLKDTPTERIAALVIGLTTPEQAALQVRSDEPSEITLGSPESALDVAKSAAVPLASATVASGKRVGSAAKTGWSLSRPHVQRAGYAAAGAVREGLSTGRRRRIAMIAVVLLVAFVGIGGAYMADKSGTAKLLERYLSAYSAYQAAVVIQDQPKARQALVLVKATVDGFSSRDKARLDKTLASAQLEPGTPDNVSGFTSAVSTAIDEIDGLSRVDGTLITAFGSQKDAKPRFMEVSGNSAYVVDGKAKPGIYVVDTTSDSVKKSAVSTSDLGNVVSTTLSSDGSGMYLLTDDPGVWFFRFSDSSLTKQVLGAGQWERGSAVASYAGNLYVLSPDGIYKHVRTLTGFSPKAAYVTTATAPGVSGATALAIDGNVFIASRVGLQQYLSGALKTTLPLPGGLDGASQAKISNGGNELSLVSGDGSRVGVWSISSGLVFSRQYAFKSGGSLSAAAIDDKSRTGYALLDGKLLSFKLQ